ncbi:MAG: hypothetical protein RL721_1339, partial [Candidatus Eisenbacteria bacterium]
MLVIDVIVPARDEEQALPLV